LAKINGNTFLLGCDPEVFVVNKKGEFVGAHGLIPGNKAEPLKVENGMVQVDGMALEFGVDPCATKREFVDRIKSVLKTLRGMLSKGYDISVTPIAQFSKEEMLRAPKEALELGCDPDYNAYTCKLNPRPSLSNPNMRSAGGHVHVGWGTGFNRLDPEFIKNCCALAVEMDYYLGVPSLSWDSDTTRRSIYGAAGALRPKTYGMEYRSLSNQWLLDEELISFVYDQTLAAIRSAIENPVSSRELSFYNGTISVSSKAIINNNWVDIGKSIYQKFKKVG